VLGIITYFFIYIKIANCVSNSKIALQIRSESVRVKWFKSKSYRKRFYSK